MPLFNVLLNPFFKQNWKNFFKIFISIFILYLLFKEGEAGVLAYLQQINLFYFLMALLIQIVSSLLAGLRWWLLRQDKMSLVFYLKSYLKGVLFNQILPTSIGGDAYRIIELSGILENKKEAIVSVLLDRTYGVTGLVLLNLLILPFVYFILPPFILKFIFLMGMGVLLSLMVLGIFPYAKISFFEKRVGFLLLLNERLKKSVFSLHSLGLILLSILINFLTVYAFYLIAVGLHLPTELSVYCLIIPLVLLMTMIPISLAGWGVREGALVYLGGFVGLAKPEALTISLLFGSLLILSSIPGLYFYLAKKN